MAALALICCLVLLNFTCRSRRIHTTPAVWVLLLRFFNCHSLYATVQLLYKLLFSSLQSFCLNREHRLNMVLSFFLSLSFFPQPNQTPVVHNIKKLSIEFQKGLCILNPENYLCKNLILSLFRIENSVTLSLHLPTEDVRWLTACVQLTPDWNLNWLNIAMTIL